MNCPKCGNEKAILLLTNYHCPCPDCENYDAKVAKNVIDRAFEDLRKSLKKKRKFKGKHLSSSPKNKKWRAHKKTHKKRNQSRYY